LALISGMVALNDRNHGSNYSGLLTGWNGFEFDGFLHFGQGFLHFGQGFLIN